LTTALPLPAWKNERHESFYYLNIVAEFDRLVDEAAGRVRATVTAAIELDAHDRDRIARELSARLNKEVKVQVTVDPRILGGLKIQYGDHVVDGTVATKLQQLRRRLVAS